MVKIKIKCPECNKQKDIELDGSLISLEKKGIKSLSFNKNVVCKHALIVYIDENFVTRDVVLFDYQLNIPHIDFDRRIDDNLYPQEDDLDLYLINLYFLPHTIVYILKAYFFKKKILLINNFSNLNKHLDNLFKFIFKDTFNYDLEIINKNEYGLNKKKYEEYILIEDNNLFNDKEDIMNKKKVKIELEIIQKFLANKDRILALITLRNEIFKIYKLCNEIINFIESNNTNKKIGRIDILNHLEHSNNTKISLPYFELLLEIMKFYFEKEYPQLSIFYHPSFFGEDLNKS